MSADLHFSEAVFGFGAGIFFVGYFLLEIPGALIVERWSARLWICRILVTWGLCTVFVGFVHSASQFYWARFFLGLAEAGFFPGVLVYMTHWFPERDRARAMAGFIVAVPLSFLIGAPLSAACLSVHWLGLPGWRWLFILQGLPAVALGIVTPFYLTDHPKDAEWLAPGERDWLTEELNRERQARRARGQVHALRAFLQPQVLRLAAALFLIVLASYGYLFWLPSTIKKASGLSVISSTLLSGLPFVLAAVAVVVMGRSSDRTGERRWHAALPLLFAGGVFALVAIPNQPFILTMVWLCLTGAALWAWTPAYWVIPTLLLGESAAAVSIGLINCVGNLGGFFGPWMVGHLLASHHSYSFAVVVLSLAFVLGSLLVMSIRVPGQRPSGDDDARRNASQVAPISRA